MLQVPQQFQNIVGTKEILQGAGFILSSLQITGSQIMALERSRKLRVLLTFSCLFSPDN